MLSLFSGIGGIDLAAHWAGIETVAFCEIEPFCQKILKKHWPDVPIFDDIKNLRGEEVGTVDIIAGGGSRAKTYQSQVNGSALLMNREIPREVDCGMKCLELLTNSNHDMSLVKTWQDCFRTMKEEHLVKSSKDWKIRTTKSCRLYLQHQTMVQLLRGKGCSSLPRPRVADTEGAPVKNSELSRGSWSRMNTKGVRHGVKLKDVLLLYKLYELKRPSPKIYEAIMGFPIGWTELNH